MKKLVIILVVLVNVVCAQEIGKIFKNEEVPAIFGKKISEVKLEADIIREALLKTNEYILFKVHNDDIIITDVYQNILYSDESVEYVDPEWVFKLFSKSIVERFFDSNSDVPEKFVYFETREKDVVLRYQDKSLDKSAFCPPFCGNENLTYGNILYINDIVGITLDQEL